MATAEGFTIERTTMSPKDIANHAIALKQMRTEFTDLEELMDSVASRGLIHPITFVRLSYEEMGDYIKLINATYLSRSNRTHFDSKRLPNGDFLVIVAGERRTRAISMAVERGLIKLSELQVQIYSPADNPQYLEMISIQLQENTGVPVGCYQQAIAIGAFARVFEQEHGHRPSYAQVSRLLKRGSSLVTSAMKFSQLPKFVIDEAVRLPGFYSKAVSLYRLIEINASERVIREFMNQSLVIGRAMTATEFDNRLASYVENKTSTSGQMSLIEATDEQYLQDIRSTTAREVSKILGTGYFQLAHEFRRIFSELTSGSIDDSIKRRVATDPELLRLLTDVLIHGQDVAAVSDSFTRKRKIAPGFARAIDQIETVMERMS